MKPKPLPINLKLHILERFARAGEEAAKRKNGQIPDHLNRKYSATEMVEYAIWYSKNNKQFADDVQASRNLQYLDRWLKQEENNNISELLR